MRAILLLVLAALLGLGAVTRASGKEALPGVDDKWRRYQSLHFELFSHNDGVSSRQLLHNLEFLHTVFLDTMHLVERRPLEVTVYFFGNERDFHGYVPPPLRQSGRLAGFYLNRPDRAVIVLQPQDDTEEAQRLIYHEYIHHLTFITGETPALWYLEGIAELFSTIQEKPDGLVLGRPIEGHVGFIQQNGLIPLAELFATQHDSPNYNETTRAGYFYAEAWALMHYWYFGRSELKADKLDSFVKYCRQDDRNLEPEKRRKLFQEATGMDYPAMANRVQRYMISGKYGSRKLPLPKLEPANSYAVRAVPREEIREQLLELDFRINRSPAGKLALLDGVEKDPGNPRRFELLGTDALIDGDEAGAREYWLQAIDAGTTNSAVFHELAMLENRRWFSQFDLLYFRLPEDTAEYLRKLLHRSIASAPNQISGYEMLAWVEATAEKPLVANVLLVQEHFSGLKEKTRTALALALVRVRLKDASGARDLLDQLEKMEPGADIMRQVELTRTYLDQQQPATP